MTNDSHCLPTLPGCSMRESAEANDGAAGSPDTSAGRLGWPATTLREPGRSERCPHCRSKAAYRWGKSDAGVARRRCRGCGRTYSWRTGTLVAGLRQPVKFAAVLDEMLTRLRPRVAGSRSGWRPTR
jgi:hypothetical protein